MTQQLTLGVDTGGTFTDFVWIDRNGCLQIHKQLSTPHDPSQAILQGVDYLAIPETAVVVHGSTVATNALLERKGARTALITTKGFADVLAIGRQHRPDIYALVPQKPDPLVPHKWRFQVNERVTAQGDILTRLDPTTLQSILEQIAADNIESIAVCLLFSFLRPEHEQLIANKIRDWRLETKRISPQSPVPSLHISLSSDILPEYREFERTATTVINAYVAPLMSRYLARLAAGLQPRPLTVMQSNGGVINSETAATQAARTALSGPAGGVVGAQYVAQKAGYDHIITFDMGGTSTDVALCPGKLPTTAVGEIADLPLRLPIIDIHTVGAGGGSLAHVDAGNALHVGPQSAGADPGPACYGRREKERESRDAGEQEREEVIQLSNYPITVATTTDANLVLGRLDAEHFLGGTMKLDVAAAQAALSELAEQMGANSAETAAWGVVQVANANMERAIRRISVERGFDPRRFTLVPFGGAGPLHACEMAANLQIPRVLIPAIPGVLSALGMLVAAPTKDYSRTVMAKRGDWRLETEDWLIEQFAPLEERASAEMAAEGHKSQTIERHRSLDMRYVGQSHELTIPIKISQSPSLPITSLFHATHEARYGYQQPQAEVEIVNVRLTAVAPTLPPQLPQQPPTTTKANVALIGEKTVWFNQQAMPTRLYDRAKLQPGHHFTGPAIVFQYDTTTVIPPEWQTAVDPFGNLILTHI